MHISKGNPVGNSTKVWITKSGGCILANNNSKIPENELKRILKIISENYFIIVLEWKKYFDVDEVKFFC